MGHVIHEFEYILGGVWEAYTPDRGVLCFV